MTDAQFLVALENCTLPAEQFDHRGHVRAAFLYSREPTFPAALTRVRRTIQAFNRANNGPDSLKRGYHETITRAFLWLVYCAARSTGPHKDAESFFAAHPDLLAKEVLQRYYSAERLWTMRAKREFVSPDLAPLPSAPAACDDQQV